MNDSKQTKEQLREELLRLRQRIAELEELVGEREQKSKALAEGEEMFSALVERAYNGITVTQDSRLVYVNPRMAEILGYTVEEILNTSYTAYFPPDELRKVRERYTRRMAGEEVPTRYQTALLHKNGHRIDVELNAGLITYAGRPADFVFIRDITAQEQAKKKLLESEEKYRNIVELAPEGIVTTDLTGVVTSCNSAFLELTGFAKDEIVGKHFSKLPTARLRDTSKWIGFFRSIVRGDLSTPVEFRWVHKDRTVRWGEARAGLIRREGRITGLQAIVRDITGRKRTEQLLSALNRAALAMERALTSDKIFTAVADELGKLGFSCVIFLTDESQSHLFPSHFSYSAKALSAVEELTGLRAKDFSVPVKTVDAFRQGVLERQTVFVDNIRDLIRQVLPAPLKELAGQIERILEAPKSINAPLIAKDEVIGLLTVQSNDLRPDDVPAITAFAHQVAAAWRKAELFEQARQEIVERGRAEEALRASEERFRSIVQHLTDIVWIVDKDTTITYETPSSSHLLGYEPGFLVGKRGLEFVHPDDLDVISSDLEEVIRKENRFIPTEFRFRHADGHWTRLEAVGNNMLDHPSIRGIIITARDITERKQAEDALRESERKWRSLYENLPGGSFVVGDDYTIKDVNDILCTLTGFTRDELVGQLCDIICPKGPHKCPIFDLGKERIDNDETAVKTKDGQRIPIVKSVRRISLGGEEGVVESFQDITELVRAEEALQNAELEKRTILDSQLEQVIYQDTDHRILWLNQAACESVGQSREDLIGRYCYETWAQRSERCEDCPVVLAMETGQQHEKERVTPDGRAWFIRGSPVWNAQGEIVGAIEVTRDVTEQVQAEAERERLLGQIQEQAQQMQQIVDTVPEGVILLDASGRIALVNPLAEKYLTVLADAKVDEVPTRLGDRPLAELLTSPPKGLWHEVTANERVFEVIARSIEAGPTPGGWVLVVRDVTEERGIRQRIQQQERLAAVGQLAAGIAHDFNNIMATITLYAQIVSESEKLSDRGREGMETINQQAKHAAKLIRQILDFSRRSILERRPLDLKLLLKEQMKLLRRTLPENILVELQCGRGTFVVDADPTSMQQMVTNLALNARDAMPGGGRLRIEIDRVTIEPGEHPPLLEMGEGEWVRITTSDTGEGIPAENLPHVFDLFFTTKEPGKGSGLGLAQVHGIVGQHEGYIDVESGPEQGTRFIIYLPVSAARPVEAAEEEIAVCMGDGETILIVEDNASTRRAVMVSLESLKYRGLEAENGREALQLLEQCADEIALVLSDVVMPEMGGVALVHALRERGIVIPVVLLTGHPMEEELKNLRMQVGDSMLVDCLPKPLNLDRLAQAVAKGIAQGQATVKSSKGAEQEGGR